MPYDLISGLKFTLSAGTDDQDRTPLRQLLIIEKEKKKSTTKTTPAPTANAAVKEESVLKSRRASRKQRKSKSAPQNFTSPNSPKTIANIRVSQIDRIQRRNNNALIELQKSLEQTDVTAKNQKASADAENFIADFEVDVQKPANQDVDAKIPVILSMVDFLPCFDGGVVSPTTAFSALELKRATRMLNLDAQTPDSKSADLSKLSRMQNVKIAEALSEYINARTLFMKSITVDNTNIRELQSILAGLNLTNRSASATEILLTLVRDYANAVKFASPRLDEVADRHLDPGWTLPRPNTGTPQTLTVQLYNRAVNSWTRNPLAKVTNVINDDAELMVKSLSNILGKETLFSENIIKNVETFSPNGTKNLDRDLFDPQVLLDIYGNEIALRAQWYDQGRTARGLLFKNFKDSDSSSRRYSNTTVNYPYEKKSVLIEDRVAAGSSLSAPDFAKKVYEDYAASPGSLVRYTGASGNSFYSPYEATSDSMEWAGEKLLRLTTPVGDSSLTKPLMKILEMTIKHVEVVPYSLYYAIQPKIFELAATDENVLRKLLIYLAFRQEKKLGYSGQGPAPEGASRCLRKSFWLRQDRMLIGTGNSKIMKTQTISPSNVSVNPAIGGKSVIRAPEQTTTIGIEIEAYGNDSGTLESIYGITFEQVADFFADELFTKMMTSVPPDFATEVGPLRTSEGEGYDCSVSHNGLRSALKSYTDSGALTEDLFDQMLKFHQYVNGTVGPSIYDENGNTYFNNMNREMVYALFVYLACKVQKLIIPKLIVNRSGVRHPGPSFEFESGKAKAPYKAKKTGSKSSNTFKIRKLAGFGSKMGLLKAFIKDPAKLSSSLVTSFPEISRVLADINDEQNFLVNTNMSLVSYFINVSRKYQRLASTMDLEVGDGSKLGDRLSGGLIPSIDSVKLLLQYPGKLNSENLNYNGKKINDPTITDTNFAFLQKVLSTNPELQEDQALDSKIMAIGLPSGILEDLELSPVSINEIVQQDITVGEIFEVVIQKIDEMQPNVQFEELRFPFSRAIFTHAPSSSGMHFTLIDNNLRKTTVHEEIVYRLFNHKNESSLGIDVVKNHCMDHALKQYLDLQYDIDVGENAFPANKKVLKTLLSSKIKIPSLEYIDTTSPRFLSGSNLAYDPEKIPFRNMEFYNDNVNTVDISRKDYSDPYKYSAFDYANTYGSLFNWRQELLRLESGTIFEKTICVVFNDSDFEIKRVESPNVNTRGMSEQAVAQARKQALDLAWKSASLTTEDAPTKMITYRAYLSLTSKSIVDEVGYAN